LLFGARLDLRAVVGAAIVQPTLDAA
jgi:hypothetical protein